ncbi:MAG TPA: hypothetical protein VI230_00560 [Ignavibacteriaceae bacterium]
MKKIIKIAYDDDFIWISNKQKIKKILENPYSPELLIVFRNEANEMDFTFLSDLQSEEVSVDNKIIQIPA